MRHARQVLPLVMALTSCTGSEAEAESETEAKDSVESISFLDTWSREFTAGPNNPHTATYAVEPASIHYRLQIASWT